MEDLHTVFIATPELHLLVFNKKSPNQPNLQLFLMFVVPYILVTCFILIQLDVQYSFSLEKFISSTCFGCHMHPSSGAQLQCTAIGFF
jgi:hypothetical protein